MGSARRHQEAEAGAEARAAREAKIQRAAVEELRRRDIIRRLLEALDKRLVHLEKRMAPDAEGEPTQSAADAERDARTLSGLARLYAKLVELDDSASAKGKPDPDKSATKPERPKMRTDSAAILRSAFSDPIRLGTLEAFLSGLVADELQRVHYDFELWARDDQLPPAFAEGGGPWTTWLMLGGRGKPQKQSHG